MNILMRKNLAKALKNENIELNSYAAVTALALLNILNCHMTDTVISYRQIEYLLSGNTELSRKMKQNYIDGLKNLDNKVIKIKDEFSDGMLIDCTKLFEITQDGMYVMIIKETFNKVYLNKGNLIINYFLILLTELENQMFIHDSINTISQYTEVDVRTVQAYNKILEENKILYIKRYNYTYKNTNCKVNNMYGLYEYKKELNSYASKFIKDNKDKLKASKAEKEYVKTKHGFSKHDDTQIDNPFGEEEDALF